MRSSEFQEKKKKKKKKQNKNKSHDMIPIKQALKIFNYIFLDINGKMYVMILHYH